MDDINNIANKINEKGGRLYLVGGAVRDDLMGITTHDEDYCVTGISSEKFQELFPNAHLRGKAFSVFDIDGREFAMARTESKIGIGHKEFKIKSAPKITIEQDLARRDITINAIAKDVLTGKIIDPFDGQKDLKNNIIRATTNRFKEDSLRVYRVARLAAKLQFTVEIDTSKMMKELKEELKTLSKERVFNELKKALETNKPSIFFEELKKANVLDIHFKEIYDLIGVEQPIKYHPEGDAYNHTMLVLDMATELTKNYNQKRKLEIRFSALVHDFGKGLTPKEEYPHHHGHEISGVELVTIFANRVAIPNSWKKCGKIACREHMRGGIFYKMKPSKKVQFIERVNKSLLGLDGLQIVVISDKTSGGRNNEKEDISFEEIGKRCIREINGKYIRNKYGLTQGIEFGKKLQEERIKFIKNTTQIK